jgi:CheY-like chemotaxis protein
VAIDIIVTEAGLSGMSGLEFLETVRSDAMNDRPAVVLTSRCDRHEIARLAATMGAVVYPKPFSPMQLVETIENSMTAGAMQGFTGSAMAACLEGGSVDG